MPMTEAEMKAAANAAQREVLAEMQDAGLPDDLNPVDSLAAPQIDAVLAAVRKERLRQDDVLGFFRDQPDLLWACDVLTAQASALKEQNPIRRETALIKLAAEACSWAEALRRRREQEKLKGTIPPKPFWQVWMIRLGAWLLERGGAR